MTSTQPDSPACRQHSRGQATRMEENGGGFAAGAGDGSDEVAVGPAGADNADGDDDDDGRQGQSRRAQQQKIPDESRRGNRGREEEQDGRGDCRGRG